MNGRRNGLLASVILTLAVPLALESCGGGGGGASAGARIGCAGTTQGMCVTRCNLGCSATGCNISEIAVNQPLNFDFSRTINPDTVNSNTIKMRTREGNEPVGTFLVQGKTVFFFPEAKVVGKKTFFGFESGKTYTLTIPSGADSLDAIESMSGDKLNKSFTCRLNVSRGIVDFDGKPPSATMLIPSGAQCVGGDTLILIEFSEVVDAATLLGDAKTAGVIFGLAQFDSQGNCSAKDLPISGTRKISVQRATQRTRLLFQPAFELPGSFCVRVRVTDRVRDLSGKRAKAVNFEFKTCKTAGVDKVIVEKFDNPGKTRDDDSNGAKWAPGKVVPATLGGSGQLGDFNVRFGRDDQIKLVKDPEGRTIYTWNTDRSVIPGIRTLTGKDIVVQNGVYEFKHFVLKENEHMRFVGSHFPVIRVAGRMEVQGVLSMAAPDGVKPKSSIAGRPPFAGQPGLPGAIGAGRGGKGGDSPHKKGQKDINGAVGENIKLPAGHPLLAEAAGTGGKPSIANPKSGDDKDACFTAYGGSISQQGAAGGGGGGFVTPGRGGSVIDNRKGLATHPPKACDLGPPSAGGKAVQFGKLLTRSEKSSFLFMIGGSGGGGGGAHTHGAFDERKQRKDVNWSPGGGGMGGGGAMQIQVGGDLFLSARGLITGKGGDAIAYPYDISDFWNLAPGGAGSGGTLLIQIAGLPDIRGPVVATGGKGGRMDSDTNFRLRADSLSGAGGDGFIRFEANPPIAIAKLGTLQPAARPENSGLLRPIDHNAKSLLATRWFDTNLAFPPKYVRYEIDARVNNQDIRYSDDPAKGIKADDNAPVTVLFQGAQLDPDTKLPDPNSISKWFVGAVDGLNRAGGNGFRFLLRFDTSKAAAIVAKEVRVFFRG